MEHFNRIESYFSNIAKRYPDHIAVKENECSLTYSKLDQLSTGFANYLLAQGVLPGDFIPIIANKSSSVIIAILGILKAGAAYVPISSDFPLETIMSILQKVDARFLCVDESCFQQKLDLASASTLLPLSAVWNETDFHFQKKIEPVVGTSYAYMVFTSGSTGIPNGVLVSHDNLIATVISWLQVYQLTPNDRHLQ